MEHIEINIFVTSQKVRAIRYYLGILFITKLELLRQVGSQAGAWEPGLKILLLTRHSGESRNPVNDEKNAKVQILIEIENCPNFLRNYICFPEKTKYLEINMVSNCKVENPNQIYSNILYKVEKKNRFIIKNISET